MSEGVDQQVFNKALCIICQKDLTCKLKVVGTNAGCDAIKRAANIRGDIVSLRLRLLLPDETFYYHSTNNCYKNYTHSSKLDKLKTQTDLEQDSEKIGGANSDDKSETTGRRSSQRFSGEFDVSCSKCIICGQLQNAGSRELKTLGAIKSQILFDASRFFQDNVLTKTATLESAEAISLANLQTHRTCIRKYELKYGRSIQDNIDASSGQSSPKKSRNDSVHENNSQDSQYSKVVHNDVVTNTIKGLEPRLILGEQFSLSDIAHIIKQNHGISIKNGRVKLHLLEIFGDTICFVYPKQANKSLIFYLVKRKQEVDNVTDKEKVHAAVDILVNTLNNINFNLQDKFCDQTDLQIAWENVEIPEPFVWFFSRLYNCTEKEIVEKNFDTFDEAQNKKNVKLLRIKSLFQILYYIKTNGHVKTPLHSLLGTFVYATTKSKNTISTLNRLGLSISYDQILRTRTSLAAYTIEACQNNFPLPSHFDPGSYVTTAFDNFDHNKATISGLNSTHDTVITLFQDKTLDTVMTKPNLSETSVNKRDRAFNSLLECQKIKIYEKNINTLQLPLHYIVDNNNQLVTLEEYMKSLCEEDFAWFLSRIIIKEKEILVHNADQQMATWSSFNSSISKDKRNVQIVGYAPIIPAPVTESSTVYTCLLNFNDLLNQLDQKYLPITCDEGVYRIARPILLMNEKEFENLILCLGSFHVTKCAQACIGRYLQESGVRNLFIETELFGANVTDQILDGKSYTRCLKCFSYLAEALRRLQLKEFFTPERLKQYENEIVIILSIQETFQERNIDEFSQLLHDFKEKCSTLYNDFNNFVSSRCNESELFKYWNNVLILIDLMLDLIRADRAGNWNLHLKTIKKLIPVFFSLDRTNYAKWCSLYLQDMLSLQKKAPEVYEQFIKGRFTVKRSLVPFTSVATDQALEQTINRSSKSTAGVIGVTKKKETVAVWDITYHEFWSIVSYFKEITFFTNDDDELQVHHELSTSAILKSETAVHKIICYLEEKASNPFVPGSHALRTMITNELVQPDVAKQILNIFEIGIASCELFTNERIINKTKPLTATVTKNNLPNFKSVTKPDKIKTSKEKKTTAAETERTLLLAKERNYPREKLLKYELTEKNKLFDSEGFFTESETSSLIREMEKNVCMDGKEFSNNDETCLVVDVMLILRKISWKDLRTFKDLAISFCNFLLSKASMKNATRIDIVFDSYYDKSLKSSEHLRRNKVEAIVYYNLSPDRVLPKLEDKFWGSSENKILLQKLLRDFILTEESKLSAFKLVFSTINETLAISNTSCDLNMLQRIDIEEADLKLMLHIKHAVQNDYRNIYLISSDTDVIVLSLYFFRTFVEGGLEKLWIRAGNAKSIRDIPLHILSKHYGDVFCSILPALHHLTGADYSSKVGTKKAALEAHPEEYLSSFGQETSLLLIEACIQKAEEYLVRVLKHDSKLKTFDELHYVKFNHGKCSQIHELPPTSNSIKLHILRALYIVHLQIHCLQTDRVTLDPQKFGWIEENGLLLPQKIRDISPPSNELIPPCTGKICSTKSCTCNANGIPCCSFCECQKEKTCKNTCSEKSQKILLVNDSEIL